jgi:hypothetical protein
MDAAPDPADAVDPEVARHLAQVRAACLSEPLEVRPELAQLLAGSAPPVPVARRSARVKTMLAAKLAAAVAAALAATGGLAVASALPAPVQSAVSDVADHLGVSLPSADDPAPQVADDAGTPSTTEPTDTTDPTEVTDPPATTTPSTEAPVHDPEGNDAPAANHGAEVSAVAHDDSNQGCEHGRAVSAVASGRVNDKPCPTHEPGTDQPDTTSPTSSPAAAHDEAHADAGHGNANNHDNDNANGNGSQGHGHGHGRGGSGDD